MAITIKLIGALRHVAGAGEFTVDCKDNVSIRELVDDFTRKLPELKRSLIDQQLDDPRPNVLILVNGREIGVLNSMATPLRDGSEVVLIPVVHGG